MGCGGSCASALAVREWRGASGQGRQFRRDDDPRSLGPAKRGALERGGRSGDVFPPPPTPIIAGPVIALCDRWCNRPAPITVGQFRPGQLVPNFASGKSSPWRDRSDRITLCLGPVSPTRAAPAPRFIACLDQPQTCRGAAGRMPDWRDALGPIPRGQKGPNVAARPIAWGRAEMADADAVVIGAPGASAWPVRARLGPETGAQRRRAGTPG